MAKWGRHSSSTSYDKAMTKFSYMSDLPQPHSQVHNKHAVEHKEWSLIYKPIMAHGQLINRHDSMFNCWRDKLLIALMRLSSRWTQTCLINVSQVVVYVLRQLSYLTIEGKCRYYTKTVTEGQLLSVSMLTIFTELFCLALRVSSRDTKALATWASSRGAE